jgi:hypothetical protein
MARLPLKPLDGITDPRSIVPEGSGPLLDATT